MSTAETTSLDDTILDFLARHVDVKAKPDGRRTVSRLRQEQIADELDLPLGRVIETLKRLQQKCRLRAERQAPGRPFRYFLLDEQAK